MCDKDNLMTILFIHAVIFLLSNISFCFLKETSLSMTSEPHDYIMKHQAHFYSNAETSTNVIKMFLGNIINDLTATIKRDATC